MELNSNKYAILFALPEAVKQLIKVGTKNIQPIHLSFKISLLIQLLNK